MTYAALSLYLVLVVFLGMGVHRLLSGVIPGKYLNWLLLPGTLVAEMAYIFGCLITGGEIRHAKLMGDSGGGKKGGKGGGEPSTDGSPKLGFFGPLLAAMLVIVACGAGILVADSLLGEPVISTFQSGGHLELPHRLPQTMNAFWGDLKLQIDLLERMVWTLGELEWSRWQTWLFVYLGACLSIRLAPVTRPVRPALLAIIFAAAAIALVGLAWPRFEKSVLADVWPLLTYVWSLLLFLLVAALLVRGIMALVVTFKGSGGGGGKSKAAKED